MKIATNQERLNELFDSDPRNDSAIAADLCVSKQTVSAWRKGIRSPKKPMLIQISELFNVSIEWLMGFDVDRTGKSSVSNTVIVPNSEDFVKIVQAMSPEDYTTVMEIFNRTYRRMKDKGEI